MKKRKEKQGANQGDWVEGTPEHMRAQGKVVMMEPRARGCCQIQLESQEPNHTGHTGILSLHETEIQQPTLTESQPHVSHTSEVFRDTLHL